MLIQYSDLIPIRFQKVVLFHAYSSIILGNEEKSFAIHVESSAGVALQSLLDGKMKARPSSHELIEFAFKGMEINVKQIVIYNYKDCIFYSQLFIEQKSDITRIAKIDARPSDSIILALRYHAPIYCLREVFDSTVSYVK
ncbi:Uncharacterized protein CLAVI_000757 [Candidatus Clavichlamydia salmonicola]|uniref:bifunctional nuclease family protein n=1 Tax=Candidatus Clavichlamydia salmonicola TaxID=469812 RepID=UPI0018915C73|nr:bifunctional nuclease domain-containing protein [Candidatus Clavichlamydia salmonicola]MBF5051122.1 Uncharacterized protein [Candidatus Clavichlamydia salmonicola]